MASSQSGMDELSQLRDLTMSSQSCSIPQNEANALEMTSALARPPSCGQDENRMPRVNQTPLDIPQHHDNLDDSDDDFGTSRVELVPMDKEWDRANPPAPKSDMIPASVPRPTGQSVSKLHELCTQYGAGKPDFKFSPVKGHGFIATLKVDGNTFEVKDPQRSMQLAKEEVCKLALDNMPPSGQMEDVEGLRKNGKKRKSGEALEEAAQPIGEKDDSENWIGILNTHCQRSKYPPPLRDAAIARSEPKRWSAAITIGDPQDHRFESGEALFIKKADAEAAAAKQAVMWLRTQGMLNEAPSKKQRTSSSEADGDVSMSSSAQTSINEEVHKLVAALGFLQPQWIATPSTGASSKPIDPGASFIDMAAHFNERDCERESRLRGPIGEVKNCFGQKQARKACAEKVLPVLLEIKRSRLAAV